MKRNVLFFIAGLLAATLGIAAAGGLLTQSDLNYHLKPDPITVTPATKDIDVRLRESNTQDLVLANSSDADVMVKAESEYLDYKVLYPLTWSVFIQPTEVTIPANGSATVKVMVTAPRNGSADDFLKLRVKFIEMP